ncbi:uncharacterized protein LOC131316299 [Rhododendron vialii]|uniref:uncharacterized protein LOC131316299 n=1 Tax=Rhododendron vialii TaxID=182163 RepID=UPI00265EE71D|nr:uncharacterized protein LOC131316299 [Rhododendron vialii]XP_058201604.1 uncharacterized protein LOC131316299 [Rhododendron vialii]
MDHDQDTQEGKGSLYLQIEETTGFRLQSCIDMKNSSNLYPNPPSGPTAHPPERKLTLLALRLAVLEKVATGLGTLGFIWATVVLLGGFAVTLSKTDFWFITMILLIEGTRIFSRSHELEWQQHQTTLAGIMKVNKINKVPEESRRKWDQKKMLPQTWKTSNFPILPFPHWTLMSKNVSKVLFGLQLASATACTVLSLMKLIEHNYGELEKGDTDDRNRKAALTIFYSLALAEALLFLLEKAYWEWKVIYCKVLEEVNEACDLGPSGMVLITRFFYVAYSRCVNGSNFDGLKMDLVSFAMDLLASNLLDEQLIGIRILNKFALDEQLSNDALRKIGTTSLVVERLVKMLTWKDLEKEEIRQRAAEILSRLASKEQNALRLSGIPGAMASISSLLQNHRMLHGVEDEIPEKISIHDNESYRLCTFNYLGLLILRKLARDHDNCGKIGNTRGLLHKIIDFSKAGERLLKDENVVLPQILMVKQSLQVLKLLASTTGTTGKKLRYEISEDVFTISNIRDILKYGEKQKKLQKLGIEILTCLGMESDAREEIGGTGGVLKELLNIFFKEGMPENQDDVRTAAGEALAMLAFESKSNCCRILNLKVIEKLIKALEVPFLCINAGKILKNLCIYVGEDCSLHLWGVIDALPIVLGAIMSEENKENKLEEVLVGLAANVVKFMTCEESSIMFERARIQEAELAEELVKILNKYQKPTIKTPRIRRFVIELAIWMMRNNEINVRIFKDLGIVKEMQSVIETTTKLENFKIFCGPVGMSQDSTTIHSLVESAMELLDE